MSRPVTSPNLIQKIIHLRKTGHSMPEIRSITGKGNSTVFKYIQGVKVLPQYQSTLKAKQGGSLERSKKGWKLAQVKASLLINCLNERDKLMILTCLYWGEGTKKGELSLSNSDPALIKVFAECLALVGVKKDDLRITIRIYNDLDRETAVNFWTNLLEIPKNKILGVNILDGKKKGKLKYGMCRIRVTKGAPYFKLIMSMIDLVKSDFNAAIVQWIEQRSPNARM